MIFNEETFVFCNQSLKNLICIYKPMYRLSAFKNTRLSVLGKMFILVHP